jgi:hypothetical protein
MAPVTATDVRVRTVRLFGRRCVVVPPSARDPRLHLAATITVLHVLGQVHFGFEVSVAQILVALGTCGGTEVVVRFLRDHEVAWPANGLLAGNGIAFLLRVEGTRPGDTWTLRGAWIFAVTGAVAVAARYLLRVGGRPLLNPSNVALVGCFVVLGTERVNPLDLWWAPMSPAMVVAYAVLAVGGVSVTWRTGMWPASVAFFATFAAMNGAVARTGHCMVARWNLGPVCDAHYWRVLTTSPEILLFGFFMITDPRTTPRGRVARVVHGSLVGVLAAGLAATQTREFGTKVAVLGSLTVVCVLRPLLEGALPTPGAADDRLAVWIGRHRDHRRPLLGALRLATASMCAMTAVLGASSFAAFDEELPGEALPFVEATAGPVGAARSTALVLPPVAVDDSVGALGSAISPAEADAMARDLLTALAAIDLARTGSDTSAVRALVSRRHLEQIQDGFGSGTADEYRFTALTIGVRRSADDPQAPPQLAVRGVGTMADGIAVDRVYPMTEVRGRWILDGDLPADRPAP